MAIRFGAGSVISGRISRRFGPHTLHVSNPNRKAGEQWPQRGGIFGQRAFHMWWHFVEDFAGNDAIALRLAQTLSQHFARDSGNEALQFQKTTHVVLAKMPED